LVWIGENAPLGTQKMLITGASGDLGRVLSQQAVAAGYEVYSAYLSRPERITAGTAIRLDLMDRGAVETSLDTMKPDIIIHTAVTQSGSNVRQQIVNAAYHLKQYSDKATYQIFLSSDLIFDGLNPPYGEDSSPSPLSMYGQGKAELELMAECVVRTSLLYDFEPGNRQVDWLADKVAKGERCKLFFDEIRNPIWTVNLAEALLELAGKRFKGVLNVAGPLPVSRLELGWMILATLGHNPDDHIEVVSQAGSGRPPDLTLDVTKAQMILKTPLLTIDEARERWMVERKPA
jgi:dTDP-4-dehydrorhamnose reductase